MNLGWRTAGLLTLLALGGAILACGPNKRSYGHENERLLATLPTIPGAQEIRRTSSPYYDPEREMFSRILGYSTNVVYQIPVGMTQQNVVDFYIAHMGQEWSHTVEEFPVVRGGSGEQTGSVLSLSLKRGQAIVGVITDGLLNGGDKIEIGIDHKGDRQPPTS